MENISDNNLIRNIITWCRYTIFLLGLTFLSLLILDTRDFINLIRMKVYLEQGQELKLVPQADNPLQLPDSEEMPTKKVKKH